MIHKKLTNVLNKRRCTLLCIGPMSLNCVDSTIELASQFEVPLILIASRRQIDSEEFGGGYVNNWNTKSFANYVIDKDKKSNILLARDHGGPWQNPSEVSSKLSLRRAMESAKLSYLRDIEAGLQILHIDPSIDIHTQPNRNQILERIFELYEYCWGESRRLKKEVLFEIGTEEQSGGTNTQDELDYTLNEIIKFCQKGKISPPTFVVVQTGTRVMEMQNIGSFDNPIRIPNQLPAEIQIPKMVEICNRYGVLMKEHNTDYLSNEALNWHPRLGIHASNVAPEFGVAESKAIVDVLELNGLTKIAEDFLCLSFESRKWSKWMLEGTRASDRDKALISGHYVFSNPNCLEIKRRAHYELEKMGINFNAYIKDKVKECILRYMQNFRLTGTV
jgi:hypothetical protein